MRFSILVCSLTERAEMLERLQEVLRPQLTDEVEVVVNVDNREKTVGRKRNELLAQAKGDYVAFVDDDDIVSPDYVAKVINAVKSNPDCCGIEGEFTNNGENRKKLVHSLQAGRWYEHNGVCFRTPNHLNPIRRDIALKVGFNELNAGEDRDYSFRLKGLLRREEYISGIIYFYDYKHNGSATNTRPTNIGYRNTFGGDFEMTTKVTYRQILRSGTSIKFNESLVYVLSGKHGHGVLEGHSRNLARTIPAHRQLPQHTFFTMPMRVKIVRKGKDVTLFFNDAPMLQYPEESPILTVSFIKQRAHVHVDEPRIEIGGRMIL